MNEYMLWYKQPAERWLDGLPIGNGTIGATAPVVEIALSIVEWRENRT